MSDCSTIEMVVFWSSDTEVFNGAFKAADRQWYWFPD